MSQTQPEPAQQAEQQTQPCQERHPYLPLADFGSPQAPRPFSHRWWLLVADRADNRIGLSCHAYRAGQISAKTFDRHVAVASYCQRRWWRSLEADLRRVGHLHHRDDHEQQCAQHADQHDDPLHAALPTPS